MPIKLVCLNLNRHDTRQQPVPAYRPASRVNKKAAAKRIYQCMYTVQQLECLYIQVSCQWNVCSHLYTEHKLHKPCMHRFVLNHYVHVYMPVIHNVKTLVYTCTYMSEHYTYIFPSIAWALNHDVRTMYISCTDTFILFQKYINTQTQISWCISISSLSNICKCHCQTVMSVPHIWRERTIA